MTRSCWSRIESLRSAWICLVAVLGLALLPSLMVQGTHVTASQQPSPPTAKEVLLAADAACLRVGSIIYDFESEVTAGGKIISVVTATVYQARANVPDTGYVSGKYFISGRLTGPDRSPQDFAYSYNGSVFRLLDPDSKSVLVLNSPKAYTVGQMLAGSEKALIGVGSFTSPDPFKGLIEKADKIDYLGTAEVDGALCHKIEITRTFNGGGRAFTSITRWFFGTKDYLPRRIESSSSRTTVKNLKINSAIDEAKFYVKAPDGYGEEVVTGKRADTKGLLAIGGPAPDWSLPDAQGRMTSLKDYRGKIVVMDFWGTWCVPCIKAMPHIQAIYDAYKDRGVVVLGVAVHDEEGDPVAYFKQHKYTYGLLLRGDEVSTLYQVELMPVVYVIGSDGIILHAEAGGRENMESEVRALIQKTLDASKP